MSSTDITYKDIVEWKERIAKAKDALKSGDFERVEQECGYLVNDMAFLVVFTESLLKIEVDQEVYDKARELQKTNYHPLAGSWEREE